MDFQLHINQMAANAQRVRVLVEGVSDEQARWKPDADSWSILEVVNHLYDEEREDFRVRLDLILHDPEKPAPGIDPQGWVTSRQYNQRLLEPSLANYLEEREKSLNWLRELSDPDWESFVEGPFGKMRAGDMFAAWVAHDLLHLRQLVELHYAYTSHIVAPYSVAYSGDW